MPTFKYKAINKAGHSIYGEAEAENATQLDQQLSRVGLSVVRCKEKNSPQNRLIKGISTADKIWICTQFYQASRAGLDMAGAIGSIKAASSGSPLHLTFTELETLIRRGKSLAECFAAFPDMFDAFFVHCVVAGEKSGDMAFVFDQLTEYYKNQFNLRRTIIKRFRQPFITTLFTSGLIFLFLAHLYYALSQQTLTVPDDVQAALLISPLSYYYLDALILLAGLYTLIRFCYPRSAGFARFIDHMVMHMPWLGEIRRMYDMSRFSLFLALLYQCGIPLSESIKSAGNVLRNSVLRERVESMAALVAKGVLPSEACTMVNLGSPSISQALRTGEYTGDFEPPLQEVHRHYSLKIDDRLDAFFQYSWPIIIAFSGVMLMGALFL